MHCNRDVGYNDTVCGLVFGSIEKKIVSLVSNSSMPSTQSTFDSMHLRSQNFAFTLIVIFEF